MKKYEFKAELFDKEFYLFLRYENQKNVARKLGVSQSKVSRISQGLQFPDVETFWNICQMMQRSPERYFEEV